MDPLRWRAAGATPLLKSQSRRPPGSGTVTHRFHAQRALRTRPRRKDWGLPQLRAHPGYKRWVRVLVLSTHPSADVSSDASQGAV